MTTISPRSVLKTAESTVQKQKEIFQRAIFQHVLQQPFQNHSIDEKASHPLPIPSWAKDLRVAAHLNLGKINYGIFL